MIEITTEIYHAVAENLRSQIGDTAYFNGTVNYETEEFYSTLTITAIIYRRAESLPEGIFNQITEVIPVWWTFSTVQECGEVLNDFSFSDFKKFIIEHQ